MITYHKATMKPKQTKTINEFKKVYYKQFMIPNFIISFIMIVIAIIAYFYFVPRRNIFIVIIGVVLLIILGLLIYFGIKNRAKGNVFKKKYWNTFKEINKEATERATPLQKTIWGIIILVIGIIMSSLLVYFGMKFGFVGLLDRALILVLLAPFFVIGGVYTLIKRN
jgi:Ca2+/Na+ antiporter